MAPKIKYHYDDLTWPEIKDAVSANRVVIIPFGAVEDHGLHLPLNTDNVIVESICLEAARRSPQDMLVMPTIAYGLDEHHMDFPGTVAVQIKHLLSYVTDVAESVAYHGFTHILLANGHGSNRPIADLAARQTGLSTGAICAMVAPNAAVSKTLAEPALSRERRSPAGGIAHAGEYETAMMLHLRPDLVQMDKAVMEEGQLKLKYFNWDHPEPSAITWNDWWSRISKSGVCGDPTVASAEFGRLVFEQTVENFIELVREFRAIPVRRRADLHAEEPRQLS
jgi:creatinine amidohydrolase